MFTMINEMVSRVQSVIIGPFELLYSHGSPGTIGSH